MRKQWMHRAPSMSLALSAAVCLSGCTTGKKIGDFAKNMWPWGGSSSSSASSSTKLAQNTPRQPSVQLPSQTAKPSTLGTQQQVAAGSTYPGYGGVQPGGGATAWQQPGANNWPQGAATWPQGAAYPGAQPG